MKETVIQKLVHKHQKRLGRGHGSGKVKTSGRGTKGQNARGKVHFAFEGGQLPLTRRLPFLRGKSKNKSIQRKPKPIEVSRLHIFSKNAVVTNSTLRTKGLLKADESAKILGGKTPLTIPLRVNVPVSKSAGKIIEKAGGTVALEK
jgi:large subunit ribosomal protein L15